MQFNQSRYIYFTNSSRRNEIKLRLLRGKRHLPTDCYLSQTPCLCHWRVICCTLVLKSKTGYNKICICSSSPYKYLCFITAAVYFVNVLQSLSFKLTKLLSESIITNYQWQNLTNFPTWVCNLFYILSLLGNLKLYVTQFYHNIIFL